MKNPEKEDSTYGHILKYTGLLGGVQVFNVVINMVRNKFAAVMVGMIGLGLIDIYSRSIELLGSATNFGLGISAVRRLSKLYDRGDMKTMAYHVEIIRTWVLFTAVLGAVLSLALAAPLSLWTTESTDYTRSFALLSVAVFCTTLTGGELAILKGTRQLKRMAAVSTLSALGMLLIAVPLYWAFNIRGIAPTLAATAFVTLLLNLRAATRTFPYRVSLRTPRLWLQGSHLLRVGASFIAAGVVAATAEMLIRSYISNIGGFRAVGLYAAGITLSVNYVRLVFVAVDSDYFPRITAAIKNKGRMNHLANCQIDVLVMLMVPVLIAFALGLPVVIRLLYTTDFLRVIPMVLSALFYMYFKAIYTPVAYLSLAKGDALVYFLMETLYYVVLVIAVPLGYHYFNLGGAGLGLMVANLIDLLAIHAVYSRRYGFRFQSSTIRRCLLQGLMLLGGLVAAWCPQWAIKIPFGLCFLGLSAYISWRLLSRETKLPEKFAALKSLLRR